MQKRFHILILSAGSLLGQNLLDALENRRSSVWITGMNSLTQNPRIFRCDKAYKSPAVKSEGFVEYLKDVIMKEKPDMVLPGRDDDVLKLAELSETTPDIKNLIPCGSSETAKIMNDKWESYLFAINHGLPFASSFVLKNDNTEDARVWAKNHGFPLLAKPIEGFGSLGIRIICDEVQLDYLLRSSFDKLLLQEILDMSKGWHESIMNFYSNTSSGIPFFFHLPDENQFAGQTIIGPDGSVGEIFASRSLMILGRCEKTCRWEDPDFTATVRSYAQAISDAGWRGMFNLQCRRTEKGYVGIEMNGRMSGSTSARGWLGYDEVRELILEFYKFDIGPDIRYPLYSKGTVYRSLTDYFVAENEQLKFEREGIWHRSDNDGTSAIQPCPAALVQVKHKKTDRKKKIIMTGSTGYYGINLFNRLSRESMYEIDIISRNKKLAQKIFGNKAANYYDQEEWLSDNVHANGADILLHLGFARPHFGNIEIAKSLQFTSNLFSAAAKRKIKGIINISSRSVYSEKNMLPCKEDSVIGPATTYGQAKFSSELLLKSLLDSNMEIKGTSIRLGTISGGADMLTDVFFLSKFVKQALDGTPIQIIGGSQEFDILDIRDASDAINALLKTCNEQWKPIYNLTSYSSYNIIELARLSVRVASHFNGGFESQIYIEEKNIYKKYGMDSSLFINDTGWHPKIKIEDTIESLVTYYLNHK